MAAMASAIELAGCAGATPVPTSSQTEAVAAAITLAETTAAVMAEQPGTSAYTRTRIAQATVQLQGAWVTYQQDAAAGKPVELTAVDIALHVLQAVTQSAASAAIVSQHTG